MNIFDLWKLWRIYDNLEAEEKGDTKMNNGTIVTPGWKTSEFWLHIASQIPTIAAFVLGASNPVVLGLAAAYTLGSAIYTVSRSQVKVAAITAAATAAADALNAAAAPAPAAAPSK